MRCPICGSKECCGGDMAQDNEFLRAEIDRLNTEIMSLRAAQPAVPVESQEIFPGTTEALNKLSVLPSKDQP